MARMCVYVCVCVYFLGPIAPRAGCCNNPTHEQRKCRDDVGSPLLPHEFSSPKLGSDFYIEPSPSTTDRPKKTQWIHLYENFILCVFVCVLCVFVLDICGINSCLDLNQ